jgi:AmmeMemoRadiSam system protein B
MNPSDRAPAVAGAFYPSDPGALRDAIASAFLDPRGPGKLPPASPTEGAELRAAVVPHAGYVYSGPMAARAYHAIGSSPRPSTVLILGVDHHGGGAPFALSARPWRTPLGSVRPDEALVAALQREPIVVDEVAHRQEHSIEVQLPFLQSVLPDVPVTALMVRFAPFEVLARVAERVRDALHGRPALLIASTDFSHYVPPETARRLDALARARILARDAPGLYETVVEREISMCGIAPTTVLLQALEDEPLRAVDLGWGHSGEAEPMREVVGYSSVLFER